MAQKEAKIQDALGLMQIYEGYIRVNDTNDFIVYEVKSITYKSARHRLKKICKTQVEDDYTLEYLASPECREKFGRPIEDTDFLFRAEFEGSKVNVIERRQTAT